MTKNIPDEETRIALLKEITRSQKQWQATIDAVTDYIFITDSNNKIRRANISFASRFNKHPREIIDMDASKLLGMDIAMFSNSASGEITIGNETYMVSMFPTMFEDDEVIVYIMKDITETKRLREQMYHSDKLASLGILVSGVAHEINNPLTAILGHTELLMMKPEASNITKELNKIFIAAERCKKIVENLLYFARQQPPQRTLEDINEIIERTLEIRAYWQGAVNVNIIKDFGEIPRSYVDSQQLQQVILNILLNAEHAIEDAKRDGRIVISTLYDKSTGRAAISISDNGLGIATEHINKIFDPFFTTKPVNKGTGLGLSIAHSIVAEHGGRLIVKSTEGQGTTFTIELPISNSEQKKIGGR